MTQSGGHSKLHWAKQAALALVDGIAGGSGSSTLGGSHVEVLTFDGASTASRVVPFSSNADALRSAINGIGDSSGAGDTYIAKGIEGATDDLNAHVHGGSNGSYKVVVLLSDGRNYAMATRRRGPTVTRRIRGERTLSTTYPPFMPRPTPYTQSASAARRAGPTTATPVNWTRTSSRRSPRDRPATTRM